MLRQTIETDVSTTMKVGPALNKVFQKMTFGTLLTVVKVDANGKAELRQTCERLFLKMELEGGQSFEYDSQAAKDPKGPIFTALGSLLKTVLASQASLEVSADGKVERFKLASDVLRAFREAPGAPAMGELFSEESFQRMSSPWPVLKVGPLKVGMTWVSRMESRLSFGTLSTDQAYTYAGPEKRAGRELHKILLKGTPSFEKREGQAVDLRLKQGESSGILFFDAEMGRFAELEQKQSITLEIHALAGGRDSVTESRTRCRLEEVLAATK